MAVASVIRLNQERVARASGWQLTQWLSTYPAAVTYPDTLEAAFLVRNVSGRESFERVATLSDLAAYPVSNLRYFEPKGAYGDVFFTLVASGNTLRITGDTLHWVQVGAPYTNREFTVNSGPLQRASGSAPQILPGGIVIFPGYTFSDDDIGRWFQLTGFVTGAFNGYCQILSVRGNTAQTNKSSAVTETSSGGWYSYRVSIETNAGAGLEPRYFPLKATGLTWDLVYTGGSTQQGDGGTTLRDVTSSNLYRTTRWTSIEPSLEAALSFMASVQDGLRRLRIESDANGDGGSVLLVTNIP